MSDPTPAQQLVAVKARRDETIAALCEHFAHDRLTLEEFEKRLDIANRALTVPELEGLLSDMTVPTGTALAGAAAAPLPTPSDEQTLVAVMGGVERRGRWVPARHTRIIAVMGGGILDFREVQLPAGETVVTIIALMGGAEVIVPPEMNVDVAGFAFMGGFSQSQTRTPNAQPGGPTLRIDGFAMMGGVDVQVREIGETASDARTRLGEQRRELRDKMREERRRLRDEWRRH